MALSRRGCPDCSRRKKKGADGAPQTYVLHVDRVAEFDIAERLAATNAEVLRGKFEEANEYAVRRDTDDSKCLGNEAIEPALGIHGAPGEKEDAHVREPVRRLAVSPTEKAMRLVDDERDIPTNRRDFERADDGVMNALKKVGLLLLRISASDLDDGARHAWAPFNLMRL